MAEQRERLGWTIQGLILLPVSICRASLRPYMFFELIDITDYTGRYGQF
jgi:hypothetical protein